MPFPCNILSYWNNLHTELKICIKCGIQKSIANFYFRPDRQTYRNVCQQCKYDYDKNYVRDEAKSKKYRQEYYCKNKEKVKSSVRASFIKNKDKRANKIKEIRKRYVSKRLSSDPKFKLSHLVRTNIAFHLKKNASNKNHKSFSKYISYTIEQLKQHLESKFEPWMTWKNHGIYNSKTWNDNDPTTWTWQIDHIIPHSILPYESMEDENFKKCWALENLIPLSAKINLLEGTRRIRHKI